MASRRRRVSQALRCRASAWAPGTRRPGGSPCWHQERKAAWREQEGRGDEVRKPRSAATPGCQRHLDPTRLRATAMCMGWAASVKAQADPATLWAHPRAGKAGHQGDSGSPRPPAAQHTQRTVAASQVSLDDTLWSFYTGEHYSELKGHSDPHFNMHGPRTLCSAGEAGQRHCRDPGQGRLLSPGPRRQHCTGHQQLGSHIWWTEPQPGEVGTPRRPRWTVPCRVSAPSALGPRT